LILNKNIW